MRDEGAKAKELQRELRDAAEKLSGAYGSQLGFPERLGELDVEYKEFQENTDLFLMPGAQLPKGHRHCHRYC